MRGGVLRGLLFLVKHKERGEVEYRAPSLYFSSLFTSQRQFATPLFGHTRTQTYIKIKHTKNKMDSNQKQKKGGGYFLGGFKRYHKELMPKNI